MSKEIKTQRLTEKGVYDLSSNPTCDYDIYREIVETFHKIISKRMVNNGIRYKLPHKLGIISVRRKINNMKRRSIDFQKTKEHGTRVYHNNYHSEGQFCFYHWDKDFPNAIFTCKQLYKFEPTRTNKRTLAKSIKENNTLNKYLEI